MFASFTFNHTIKGFRTDDFTRCDNDGEKLPQNGYETLYALFAAKTLTANEEFFEEYCERLNLSGSDKDKLRQYFLKKILEWTMRLSFKYPLIDMYMDNYSGKFEYSNEDCTFVITQKV